MKKDAKKDPGEMRPYKVYAIKAGVVIDHIPARKAFDVIDILGVNDNGDSILTLGVNLESSKHKRKDVVKIEGKALTHDELNKIALVAPNSTVNIIREHEVYEKIHVKVPKEIRGMLQCTNPKCITNVEDVDTYFLALNEDPFGIRCHYCERTIPRDEFRFKR